MFILFGFNLSEVASVTFIYSQPVQWSCSNRNTIIVDFKLSFPFPNWFWEKYDIIEMQFISVNNDFQIFDLQSLGIITEHYSFPNI